MSGSAPCQTERLCCGKKRIPWTLHNQCLSHTFATQISIHYVVVADYSMRPYCTIHRPQPQSLNYLYPVFFVHEPKGYRTWYGLATNAHVLGVELTLLCLTALANTLFVLNSGSRKTRSISTAKEKTSPSGPASIAHRRFSTGTYPGVPVVVGVMVPTSIHIRVSYTCLEQGGVGSRVDGRGLGIRCRQAYTACRERRD